jgi:DNA-directed RNA polymerase subunit L
MFRNYSEAGPALLTDSAAKIRGSFILENTTTTIANTLRRAILADTRSVGFRADLTNAEDPGVVIRKNTSVIFNEMLAHRLTLLPLGVVRIDDFNPADYECVLQARVEGSELRHVKASDFVVRKKGEDGQMVALGPEANAAMFPADPVSRDTCLLATLRPQWSPDQRPEEVDLTAYPVIGTGKDFVGFCPVAQCTFENTPDTNPARQEEFFQEWLRTYKKIEDSSAVAPDLLEGHRKEWATLGIQRCFLVDPFGQPNSFTFTVESVGIRPVRDIVAEGIRAVVALLRPFADANVEFGDIGVSTRPVDSRMNGVDIVFEGQEHTLGNLLQTTITEMFLDTGAPDSPITYAGYKIPHPLHKSMVLRLGIREGVATPPEILARQIVADAAAKALATFEDLARGWAAPAAAGVAAPNTGVLDG